MQIDKTTITDLSIFLHDEEQSVFHHLNFTRTIGGKEWLRLFLSKPLERINQIEETQQTLQQIISVYDKWPFIITNGTIMVIEKFYETQINDIPAHAGLINSLLYKIFNGPDFSIIRYSITHFTDFVKGLHNMVELLSQQKIPAVLRIIIDRINMLLNRQMMQSLLRLESGKKLSAAEILRYGYFIRRHFRQDAHELIDLYSRLDAYHSLATACMKYQYCFPELIISDEPTFTAQQLYHPLLQTPVSYNIELSHQQNFLFLTGANMAGKSTFIKAVGVAVYLAHIGMGVPAKYMQLSLFDGLLSNIQVEDNIIKGESYFFNEVQRVRKTIEKISDGKHWLILVDELFKGTNVQDAMKCSTVVIEGLLKMKNALFILSTHLYEIGEALKRYPNIQFRFFETQVQGDQLLFSYHLKEGISNDRLGYLILKREGVVSILEKL